MGTLEGVNRGQRLIRSENSITQVAGGIVGEDNRPQSRITVKLEVSQNDLAATGVAEDRHVVEVECAEKSVEVLGQCVVVVAPLWFVRFAMTTGIESNHPELVAQSLKLILVERRSMT